MEPSDNEKYITEWNRLEEEFKKNMLDHSIVMKLWALSIKIYNDGGKDGLECGTNMVRILDSIKLYNNRGLTINVFGRSVYPQFNLIINESIHNLLAIIRNAIKTCCYFNRYTPDIPDGLTKLVLLKDEDDTLFEKYVDEILEDKKDAAKLSEIMFVIHSGFKKKFLGVRSGPSPISSDVEGVFICKLREAIIEFLDDYKIKYEKSKRFAQFDQECKTATKAKGSTAISPSSTKPAIDQEKLNFAAEIAVYLMENPDEMYSLLLYIFEPRTDSEPNPNPNFEKFFSEVVFPKDKVFFVQTARKEDLFDRQFASLLYVAINENLVNPITPALSFLLKYYCERENVKKFVNDYVIPPILKSIKELKLNNSSDLDNIVLLTEQIVSNIVETFTTDKTIQSLPRGIYCALLPILNSRDNELVKHKKISDILFSEFISKVLLSSEYFGSASTSISSEISISIKAKLTKSEQSNFDIKTFIENITKLLQKVSSNGAFVMGDKLDSYNIFVAIKYTEYSKILGKLQELTTDCKSLTFKSGDSKKHIDDAKTKFTEMTPEEVTDVITKCSLWLLGFNNDDNPTKELIEKTYKSKITNSTTQQLLYLLGQARDTLISVDASSLKRHSGGYKRNKTKRNRKSYKTIRRNNKNKNKKQYRRKRHTKKYKKSHRKSRR